MKKLNIYSMLMLFFVGMNAAWADDTALKQKLTAAIQQYLPGIVPDEVYPTPVKGLYEVHIGPRLYYFSEDGRYLLEAQMMDLKEKKDLTEPAMRKARLRAMGKISDSMVLVYSPEKPRFTITVFTDIDCPFCRKMHSEIDAYNKLGIRVRYVLYPRTQVGSPSYQKAVSVWCASDRKQAFNQVNRGEAIPAKTCTNPVQDHMRMGKLMGVRGTPTILFEDGDMVASYIPPAGMLRVLLAADSAQKD